MGAIPRAGPDRGVSGGGLRAVRPLPCASPRARPGVPLSCCWPTRRVIRVAACLTRVLPVAPFLCGRGSGTPGQARGDGVSVGAPCLGRVRGLGEATMRAGPGGNARAAEAGRGHRAPAWLWREALGGALWVPSRALAPTAESLAVACVRCGRRPARHPGLDPGSRFLAVAGRHGASFGWLCALPECFQSRRSSAAEEAGPRVKPGVTVRVCLPCSRRGRLLSSRTPKRLRGGGLRSNGRS